MILPNTLIVGVQKSATTWLAERLSQHPDIFVVSHEIHFFDRDDNYRKGARWYASHFEDAREARIRCEKTGAYFWTTCNDVVHEPKDKLERIRELLPDSKFIVILRSPVERAISAWNHNVRSGRIAQKYDIEHIFERSLTRIVTLHGILTRGLYYQQLNRFWSVLPRDSTLVLFQEEDVIANPLAGLRKVCNFLEVDQSFKFVSTKNPANRYDATRLGVSLAAKSNGLTRRAVIKLDRHVLTRLPLKRLDYPRVSSALKEKISKYYAEDLEKLSELIGPLPTSWLVNAKI